MIDLTWELLAADFERVSFFIENLFGDLKTLCSKILLWKRSGLLKYKGFYSAPKTFILIVTEFIWELRTSLCIYFLTYGEAFAKLTIVYSD